MAIPWQLIASMGASIAGGLFGGRAQNRNETNQINQLNYLDQFFLPLMQQLGLGLFDPGRQGILDQLGTLDPQTGLNPLQAQIFGQAQQLFGGPESQVRPLGFNLDDTLGFGANERGSVGMEILANRGQTADTRFLMDRVGDIFAGARNDPRLNLAAGIAFEGPGGLLSGGRTPETGQAINQFLDVIGSRGQTPQSRALFGQGMDLLRSGGMTPGLRDIQSQANLLLSQGGMTPEARQLFQTLMPIIQAGGRGGALMPEQQALSFARDAAATASAQQAEANRRQALQRGGGAGATVASGLQNQAMAEFADQAARNEAAALREAAGQQQALQLQQLLGTSATAGDITRQAAQLIASSQGLLGDVARASAQNLGTGANLGIGSQQLANQLFGTGVSGLDAMLGQELGRFNASANLLLGTESQRRQMEQVASQLGLGVGGLELNRLLGGAGLLTDLTNQGLTARGQELQNQQFNLQNQGNLLNFMGNLSGAGFDQMQGLNNILLAGGLDILGGPFTQGMGNRGNTLLGFQSQQNPFWSNLLNAGMSSLPGAARQAFPGIFGIPGGGGGGFDPMSISRGGFGLGTILGKGNIPGGFNSSSVFGGTL